jgi:hypothetical protein
MRKTFLLGVTSARLSRPAIDPVSSSDLSPGEGRGFFSGRCAVAMAHQDLGRMTPVSAFFYFICLVMPMRSNALAME